MFEIHLILLKDSAAAYLAANCITNSGFTLVSQRIEEGVSEILVVHVFGGQSHLGILACIDLCCGRDDLCVELRRRIYTLESDT